MFQKINKIYQHNINKYDIFYHIYQVIHNVQKNYIKDSKKYYNV